MQRLSAETLSAITDAVAKPRYDRKKTRIGHVHIGAGAFMRAHIAVYNDDAMSIAGGDWGIAGVSLRSSTVRDQLKPQDCLYNFAICDNSTTDYRLIGSIMSIDVASDDPDRILELIADPGVSVATITVTEKGYGIRSDSGTLDTSRAEIVHDLASLQHPRSTIGFLIAGLVRRRDKGAGSITIISCDNLQQNGRRLQRALLEFAKLSHIDILSWLDENVRFPNTMVDRIVPSTTDADLKNAETTLGVSDAALVRTERFSQWVIENDFAGARPAWDKAGALFVDSVEPYELAKLRLLNGAHSALAYLGYLSGHSFVHEVIADEHFETYIRHLMSQEISPVTPQPNGMQHADYIDTLVARFCNSSLKHQTAQIAMDGSHKLPQRLLNTIREQLRCGGPITGLSLAVAAWMRYALGREELGQPIDVHDPLADRYADIASQAHGDANKIVWHFLQIEAVFGADLPEAPRLVALLVEHLTNLIDHGATNTVAKFAAQVKNRS